MPKLFYLYKIKTKSRDDGFITIEIIISMLIAFVFLMGSLQALVFATVMSVGAREDQRADKWIQEQIEELNDLGSSTNLNLADDANPANTVSLQAACNGNFNGTAGDGYDRALWNLLRHGTDPTATAASEEYDEDITYFGKTLTVKVTKIDVPDDSPTPHRILGINYEVTDEDNNEIANRYVEIIPDAALECS